MTSDKNIKVLVRLSLWLHNRMMFRYLQKKNFSLNQKFVPSNYWQIYFGLQVNL